MNNDMLHQLLRRYAAAQKPWRRFLLKFHVQYQRLYAKWLTHRTDFVKRGLDIIVSLSVLLFLSPLLGLIALGVWLEDGGPVFFSQTRVGQYGRRFKMYKIRSMCLDAEQRLKDLLA